MHCLGRSHCPLNSKRTGRPLLNVAWQRRVESNTSDFHAHAHGRAAGQGIQQRRFQGPPIRLEIWLERRWKSELSQQMKQRQLHHCHLASCAVALQMSEMSSRPCCGTSQVPSSNQGSTRLRTVPTQTLEHAGTTNRCVYHYVLICLICYIHTVQIHVKTACCLFWHVLSMRHEYCV